MLAVIGAAFPRRTNPAEPLALTNTQPARRVLRLGPLRQHVVGARATVSGQSGPRRVMPVLGRGYSMLSRIPSSPRGERQLHCNRVAQNHSLTPTENHCPQLPAGRGEELRTFSSSSILPSAVLAPERRILSAAALRTPARSGRAGRSGPPPRVLEQL